MSRAHRVADHPARARRGRSCRERPRAPARARCARQRLVKPAIAFCSWMTSGRRVSQAATPPGPVTKPPRPTTTSGWWRRMTASACTQRAAQAKRRREPGQQALAAQPADRQPLDRNALGGDDARLETALGTEPDHLERLLAQQPRERQRREHVPAGAAGHDEDRAAHVAPRTVAEPRCSRVASWYTRSSSPTQASATIRLERP